MTDWARLLEEHGPTMYRVAHRLLGVPQDAEDCVHDVFVEVIGKAEPSCVRNWPAYLSWLTANRALDRLRRTRCLAEFESAVHQVPGDSSSGESDHHERLEWIRCAVASLPERRRAVFSLRYFAELSYEQIAEVLGLEASTVGVTLGKAREQLRNLLPAPSNRNLSEGASP